MTARTARPTTTVAPATVTIMGTISDPSGYPLAGITIVLFECGQDDDGVRLETTTTDDVGGYRFTRVRTMVGDGYRVEARDDSGGHVAMDSSFTIGTGATTTHRTVMPVAGYIQGMVTIGTVSPQPASHVCVTAAGENTVEAAYVSANGRFRIGGLPAGEYTVVFHDDVHLDDDVSAHWTSATVAAGRMTTIEDQALPAL